MPGIPFGFTGMLKAMNEKNTVSKDSLIYNI
jgi:hypothetical protein